ncbi:MAG: methionine ABC transporter substrate-binding protein [Lactobacillaceae bacterium]|jgi:D-methionine transport system substrate-binding protein|nr:methionine ABC transporter substrate-binding protein [Lactobacillaceae bacterium]
MKKIILSIIGLIAVYAIAAFSFHLPPFNGGTQQQARTIKVGIMAGSKTEDGKWKLIAKNAKKYNLDIKLTRFTDYSQPNAALQNKDIDVNAFQHYAFLEDWNKSHKNSTLVPVGETVLAPGPIFSEKYKKISDIPDGATITVPNDPSNLSRALFTLQAAGLIKIKSDVKNPSVTDISENKKDLKIKLVQADQTLASLQDVAAAFVNSNFITAAKKDVRDSIFLWTVNTNETHQWVNILAARKDNEKDSKVKDLIKAFQQKNVGDYINSHSGGSEIAAWKGAPKFK